MPEEPIIRAAAFAGVFLIMAVWEVAAPRRHLAVNKDHRWLNNLAIVVLDTVVMRVLFPMTAAGAAWLAEASGWGVLNWAGAPLWLGVVLGVIALDFAVWAQHVMFHAVPGLWRFHRMHHADLDFDVTTGLRFHPIEIAVSMGIKLTGVVLLGAPALAVVIFEVLLNATSMFNHANIRIPTGLERVMRWVVVTPDMHRVHHSWYRDETDTNFGFNLPWWDRLFGTYTDEPRDGHEVMTIGIDGFRDPTELRLDRMLLQPFRRTVPYHASESPRCWPGPRQEPTRSTG